MTLRVFSYGGGVQSTACLVLAARGDIDFRTFLFANTGDDSEHPDTLRFVRDVAAPFAAAHGIELLELRRHTRAGKPETLRERLVGADGNVPIPVYFQSGKSSLRRGCTTDFKVRVIGRWLREHGASKSEPATVGLGISVDEFGRAHPGVDLRMPVQDRTYPLLDLGFDREDCRSIIATALPVPPKSACFFCPYNRQSAWVSLRRERPELFADACKIEETLGSKTTGRLGERVYLTRRGMPLDVSVPADAQLALDFDGGDCDSGYCMT